MGCLCSKEGITHQRRDDDESAMQGPPVYPEVMHSLFPELIHDEDEDEDEQINNDIGDSDGNGNDGGGIGISNAGNAGNADTNNESFVDDM